MTEARFDQFESTFRDDTGSVMELRPHSFASVPKSAEWQYQGYGKVTGVLPGKPAGAVAFQFRTDVSQVWDKGDVVLHLAPGPMLAVDVTEISVRRPGKKAVPVTVKKTERNGRLSLRLGKAPKDYGTVTEVVARFEFEVIGAPELLTIDGLRIQFFPKVDKPLKVHNVPRGEAIDAVERRWIDWRRAGQARLSDKFRFLNDGTEDVILQTVVARPKAEYGHGHLSVSLTGDSEIRMKLDPRKTKAQNLDIELVADKGASLTLDGPLGADAPRTVVLAAETPQVVNLPLTTDGKPFELILREAPGGSGGRLHVRRLSLPGKEVQHRLVSVNPDAESFFGHFLNYEARLGKALAAKGKTHLIAGPVDAEPRVYESHPEMAKVFSVRTNKLYSKIPGEAVPGLDTFEAELDRYLASLDHSTPTQLFMYCGSLEIAQVFGRLADKYPSCRFAISLYYLSWLDLSDQAVRTYWTPRLAALSAHPRIRLIVPSPELADEMRAGFGVETEILPHPTTTFHDHELGTLQAGGDSAGDGRTTVVFPGNLRGGKGFDLTKDALLALLENGAADLRLRVRFPPADSVNKARQEFFDKIRDRVEIMDSYLDEEEFRALLLSADLVALPYTPDRFSNRTSGLLIDSLLLGVPCVVIDKTWLAGQVRSLGFGRVVDESGKSLAAGIRDAVNDIATLKKAALAGRDRYVQTNSWDALVEFLGAPKQTQVGSVSSPALAASNTAPVASTSTGPQARKDSRVPRRMLIIGNGPSTRLLAEAGFDKIPSDMDTWGTTAAYRYFERVGWWPTYYALADRKVVFHHRGNFARLLEDPKVTTEKFFLSWKVSDSKKLEVIPHSSTGSFSLKKAIELGYTEIYLIGMEGAYVEEILESRPLSPEEIEERGFGVLNLTRAESKLRIIDRTPTFNPNYFFSGYQLEGDVYSLPQAHTHQANWDGVKSVAAAAGAKVVNLSRISKIDAFERGEITDVFPFLSKDCWNDFSDPFTEKAQHAKSVYSIVSDRRYTQKSANTWVLGRGSGKSGSLRAVFDRPGVTEGRTLVTGMTLTASSDVKLTVTFGRDGRTEYEGTGRVISLKAGKPMTVELSKSFRKRHKMLKLQISDVENKDGNPVDFQIDNIWLTESADSVAKRHEAEELTARRARIAFDEGNDSYALGAWIHLREVMDSDSFDARIAEAAARIGIEPPYDAARIVKLLVRNALPKDKVPPVTEVSDPVPVTPKEEPAVNGWLGSLLGLTVDPSDTGRANARSIITGASAALLLDPVGGHEQTSNGMAAKKLAAALEVLPKDDRAVAHYQKVLKIVGQTAGRNQ